MSVPKWKRKESPVAFLDNAREILVLTYRMAKKLPKSATFYFSLDLFSYAKKAYECISIANSTDNRSEEGRSIRKQKFSEAIGEYESMDMLAGLAYEAITEKKFTDKELAELGTRIDTERKLLKGTLIINMQIGKIKTTVTGTPVAIMGDAVKHENLFYNI